MSVSLTRGSSRETLSPQEVQQLRQQGSLVVDARRVRPRYFDGRFLAARDLIRDQQYMLVREADLARSVGSGVAEGLQVEDGATAQTLLIRAGQGVTPAGELVRLPADLSVNLADIAMAEQLSARFGLSRLPSAPPRSRTGLFVLALRPVEYTDNPVGAYPTSLTGPRTVEDGDVIEATAVVLIPWQEDGAADPPDARRARAARTIFTQPQDRGVSANVLPLAMLALQSNTLRWIDEAMVRRELGSDRGDLPGLGFSPRGLRLAHLMQYQNHLVDVMAQLSGRAFAAASQFEALPPAGPLPPGVINTVDFTQRFFPSMVDVDFSVIPEDELPALVEETLALPPTDLRASDAALDLTAVMVLAPVPRDEFRAVLGRLASRSRVLKPAAPNLLARRRPLEVLQGLRLPLAVDVPATPTLADAEWSRLAQLPTLWYLRQRHLAYRDDLVGVPQRLVSSNDLLQEQVVATRVAALGLTEPYQRVLAASTPQAAALTVSLLASPRLVASPALTAATLGSLVQKVDDATPGASPVTGSVAPPAPAVEVSVAPPSTVDPVPAADTADTAATASTPPSAPAPTPAAAAEPGVTGVPAAPLAINPSVRIDAQAVQSVAAEVARPGVGAGLANLEAAGGATLSNAALTTLASGTAWKSVDSVAATAAPAQVELLAQRLNSSSPANLNLAKTLRSAQRGTLS